MIDTARSRRARHTASEPHQLYVWYRVAGDPSCARDAITSMMLDVAMRTGVAGRLFERAEDETTWMEVYADVDDRRAFERALARAVKEHGARAFADGDRHVECFCAAGAMPR
ncbi:MAG: DUF4936 family protein [Betaproteobacteria bacterium]